MIVLINGLERTGSTLIYQLVKDLLNIQSICISLPYDEIKNLENFTENFVVKKHGVFPKYDKKYYKVIAGFRNIYDCIYSSIRVWPKRYGNSEHLKKDVKVIVDKHKEYFLSMWRYKNFAEGDCLVVSYKLYYNDNVHLINTLCKFLSIDVSGDARQIIANYNSIDSVKEKVGDDLNHSAIAYEQFRKGHIADYKGLPGEGKNNLPEEIKDYIRESMQ